MVPKITKTFESDEFYKEIQKKIFQESYHTWIKNFSLNLPNIWNESSARELDPTFNERQKRLEHAVVIGRGPSINKYGQLESLAQSDYKDCIICCDGKLIEALEYGVTPKKFPNYYVVTTDPHFITKDHYDNKIVEKYGSMINGFFTTISDPSVVECARNAGIKIYWFHSLIDYNEGKKSFNYISSLMVHAKKHLNGLPAIQTGGNVGTASWFISWKILQCSKTVLIGINHGWDEDDSWDMIFRHGRSSVVPKNVNKNSHSIKKLLRKIYNPEFNSYCVLDPQFQLYSDALKEFILRSPHWLTTINATEGGSIFGPRITCITFKEFLRNYQK